MWASDGERYASSRQIEFGDPIRAATFDLPEITL